MREQRAWQILQSLVDGVDPTSGQKLPVGTVMQSAEVIRALLVGIAALRLTFARAERQSLLPENVGRPWTR
jgi:hypothetical protein